MSWIGKKKLAFIPVYRPSYDPAPPPDWAQQIARRIYFDPDALGVDVSLRNYIYTTSYGRADLEGQVLPMVEVNQLDVPVDALAGQYEQSLRNQGFDAAAIVMLGGFGAGSAQAAGFWARFVMVEGVGVWAMELTHVLTGYWDLYIVTENLGSFDNMACACGTHPSAFTKQKLGWLDASAVATHMGQTQSYDLHTLGLVQPPPTGRSTAVQVGTGGNFLMVEARQKVDRFDARIPSEGVIVYEVLNPDADPDPNVTQPLIKLRTPAALAPGQVFTSSSGVTVQVTGALAGGFSIGIVDPSQPLLTTVPYVLFDPAPVARTDIIAAKLVPHFTGANPTKNSWVNTQSPLAGAVVAQGSAVTMVLITGPTP